MTLRDEVADQCLKQWSHWMRYLFSKAIKNKDGSVTIPKQYVERWAYQMVSEYQELSKKEKESDLEQADNFLNIISSKIESEFFIESEFSGVKK